MNDQEFRTAFENLTGNEPFPWQELLYEHFLDANFRSPCCLPTGLGKTAILAIWLIALANKPRKIPRRLVYIVNRRTVVDQATDEARRLRERLTDVPEILRSLQSLSVVASHIPLAISSLRGQFADNGEWRDDPARPAIIVGTVDMIGSRLLFSGYRCGFKSKPTHAGLLGQDALIVHDEAHLEPAFQQLLESIRNQQNQDGDSGRIKVIELTATARGKVMFSVSRRLRKPPSKLPPTLPNHFKKFGSGSLRRRESTFPHQKVKRKRLQTELANWQRNTRNLILVVPSSSSSSRSKTTQSSARHSRVRRFKC